MFKMKPSNTVSIAPSYLTDNASASWPDVNNLFTITCENNFSGSNWMTYMYGDVTRTIYAMAKLSEDHPLHLEAELAERAASVLSAIGSSLSVEAPKIINEDGEAVTLTWLIDSGKRYVSIDNDEVELVDRDFNHHKGHTLYLGKPTNLDISKLIELWNSPVNNSGIIR